MIKLQRLTPKIYYNQSRDFQFIGRLFDVVLNSIKTNVELIDTLPLGNGIDSKLIDLMAMTLGFKAKHDYNIKQLTALCSAFMTIIKNKGSLTAIQLAGQTLINAEGITEKFECATRIAPDGSPYLEVIIPQQFSDTSLFKDLLNYILPAGVGIKILIAMSLSNEVHTDLEYVDDVEYYINKDTTTAYIPRIYDANNITYHLTDTKPLDWTANYYKHYYQKDSEGNFVLIDEFAASKEHPWQDNYYYEKHSHGTEGGQDYYTLLTTKPDSWEHTYFKYYTQVSVNPEKYEPIAKAPSWKADTYFTKTDLTEITARANGGMFINSTIILPDEAQEYFAPGIVDRAEGENNAFIDQMSTDQESESNGGNN